MILVVTTILSLVLRAAACAGDQVALSPDTRTHQYPQVSLTPPYRPLVWGDFNVIQTTDTHGWLLGHQKLSWAEPNYRWVSQRNSFSRYGSTALPTHSSGDLGDFASFVTHMKQIAIVRPPIWRLC